MRKEHKYIYLMIMLDQLLTDKDHKTCVHTFKNSYVQNPENFIDGELYYLSDGGYSRIAFDGLYMIFLTSESRQEIKNRWKYQHVQIIIDLLNNLLNEIYTTMLSR